MKQSKFYNDDADSVTATGAGYEDVVAITGSGIVDYIAMRAVTNVSTITKFRIVIDNNNYDFDFTIPYGEEIGMDYNNSARRLLCVRKLIYNTNFKVQAYFSGAQTVDFKYSVLTHENE